MSTMFRGIVPVAVWLAIASGCTGAGLEGNLFDVTLVGVDNDCTGEPLNRRENHEYRLVIDGLNIVVAIGEDEWATGSINGCRIEYESVIVTDVRNDAEGNQHEIRWRITGEAEIDQSGGASCIDEGNLDWIGTETIEVIRSQHPNVDPGCTYSFESTGLFTGFASEPEEETSSLPPT